MTTEERAWGGERPVLDWEAMHMGVGLAVSKAENMCLIAHLGRRLFVFRGRQSYGP